VFPMLIHSMFGKTHVGKMHPDNQDEIITRRIIREGCQEVQLIGVADGISQTPYGGSVARWLMRKHLEVDSIFSESECDIGREFVKYLCELNTQFSKEFEAQPDMLRSGASLSVACLWGDSAICVWAGDCPIFLTVPKGKKLLTNQISIPDAHRVTRQLTDCFGANMPFAFKKREFTVPEGGILTIASDGAQSDEFTLNDLYQAKSLTPLPDEST
jgi:serine/threonine protein phosphatase PrpC